MNDDLISRAEAIIAVEKSRQLNHHTDKKAISAHEHEHRHFMRILTELPSAQPETAKRIVGKSKDGMILWYQCEICNEPIDEQDTFCRGCGRRLVNE